MKTCIRCHKELPLSSFHIAGGNADGRNNRCKECIKESHAAYYKKNKEEILRKNREWTSTHKGRMSELSRCWRVKNREKTRAWAILGNEVRKGRVIKRPCEVCGSPKAEAHHDDYSKPLAVRWLCKDHHEERHHGAV